jgi:hypothetical protein
VGGLAISPVQAHHSAAHYDFKTPVVIQGSVKEIRVANPHMRLDPALRKDGADGHEF